MNIRNIKSYFVQWGKESSIYHSLSTRLSPTELKIVAIALTAFLYYIACRLYHYQFGKPSLPEPTSYKPRVSLNKDASLSGLTKKEKNMLDVGKKQLEHKKEGNPLDAPLPISLDFAKPDSKSKPHSIEKLSLPEPTSSKTSVYKKGNAAYVAPPLSLDSSNPVSKSHQIGKPSIPLGKPSLPEPLSCKPKMALIKYGENESAPYCMWPEDLSLLGLTEKDKDIIDSYLREAAKAEPDSIEVGKKGFKYKKGEHVIDAKLPISLHVSNLESKPEFILLSKKTIFTGGERNIRYAYNVTKGEFLLKKRVVGFAEKSIITCMLESRTMKGKPSLSVDWRSGKDKKEKSKLQMLEPIRDGTISILFGTKPFERLETKKNLIKDFLEELASLHCLIISSFNIKKQPPKNYPAFHLDIKFANTLVFLEKGQWHGELSDFGGGTANPTALVISHGFISPEYIKFYNELRTEYIEFSDVYNFHNNRFPYHLAFMEFGISKRNKQGSQEDIIDFNLEHAQDRDIWAMGLIILSILAGRTDKTRGIELAPLPFLIKCFESKYVVPWYDGHLEIELLNLTQDTLDKEINQLELEALTKHPNESKSVASLFHLVRKMLKINPDERAIIFDLLKEFNEIVSAETPKKITEEPIKAISKKTGKEGEPILSEPISSYPKMTLVKHQETETDLCRYWPEDLSVLGLSHEEKNMIDSHLRDAFRAGYFSHNKNILEYKKTDTVSVKITLPVSFIVFEEDSKDKVILNLPTFFNSSKENQIPLAYDLITGQILLKRKMNGTFEEKLSKILDNKRETTGRSNVVAWVKEEAGIFALESMMDETLSILFGSKPLELLSTKQNLIRDLIEDLSWLHEIKSGSVSVTLPGPRNEQRYRHSHLLFMPNSSPPNSIELPSYLAFHLNITFDSILASLKNGQWRVELGNLKCVADPTIWSLTKGFTPPEFIKFYSLKKRSGIHNYTFRNGEREIVDFNLKYGQKRDIWALGLVFLSILVNRTEEVDLYESTLKIKIPPLVCLKNCFYEDPYYLEKGILKLTQDTLDKEINALEQEVIQKHKNESDAVVTLFNLVRKMVRIDPNERSFSALET